MINEADRLERDVTMVITTNFQTPSDTGEIPAFFTVDEKEELAVRLIARASTVNSSEGPELRCAGRGRGDPASARRRGVADERWEDAGGSGRQGTTIAIEVADFRIDSGGGGAPPSTRVAII